MDGYTLKIVFQGLIALVPILERDATETNRMVALVLNATKVPEEIQKVLDETPKEDPRWRNADALRFCFEKHGASITFPTTSQECLADRQNGCKYENHRCTCTLDRQVISLEPKLDPPKSRFSDIRPRSLPFDNSEESAGSFAYIANLSHLGYQINSAFLEPNQAPPAAIVARFEFPFKSLLACRLVTRSDERAAYVHPLEFRPLGSQPQQGELSQAVAQELIAKLDLGHGKSPKLRLTKFENPDSHFEFTLGPGSIQIQLVNHRSELPPGHPCNDGVGRDFGLFYDLAESPPAWPDREIPHLKHTAWKSMTDLDPPACDDEKVPINRPICPIGSFNPHLRVE